MSHLEATIKRAITKIYKSSFGKGPETTRIRVLDNVVMMMFEGALTEIEMSLLETEEGAQLVADMRKRMVHQKRNDYIPTLEEITGRSVLSITHDFNAERNHFYVFVIFSDMLIQTT